MPCRPGRLPTARAQVLWVGHRLKWNGCYRLTRNCNKPCSMSCRRPKLQRVPTILICQGNCEQREVTEKPRDTQRAYQSSSLLLSRAPITAHTGRLSSLDHCNCNHASPGGTGIVRRVHPYLWDVNQHARIRLACSSPSMAGIRFQRTTSLTP